MTIRDIDLNLLKSLRLLLTERNVTRTGEQLGRSQSAISNSLRRLRQILGDELLVRGPHELILTPRAQAIQKPLLEGLAIIEGCLFEGTAFNRAEATDVFRLSAPDRISLAIVPTLVDRLQRLAPKMSLHVITADRDHALDLLSEDQTDIAIGFFEDIPRQLNTERMLEEDFRCILRRGHPLLKPGARFDMAAVLSYPQVVVSATGGRTSIIDDLLVRRNVHRDTLVRVTNFTVVPHLLLRGNRIGIFAKQASTVLADTFGLAIRPVPVDVGTVVTNMAWHIRNDRDQKHAWLRQLVKSVYQEI